ncbi:MAG: hypothetical protein QW616_05750 [Thermoplasmata archaeon]
MRKVIIITRKLDNPEKELISVLSQRLIPSITNINYVNFKFKTILSYQIV